MGAFALLKYHSTMAKRDTTEAPLLEENAQSDEDASPEKATSSTAGEDTVVTSDVLVDGPTPTSTCNAPSATDRAAEDTATSGHALVDGPAPSAAAEEASTSTAKVAHDENDTALTAAAVRAASDDPATLGAAFAGAVSTLTSKRAKSEPPSPEDLALDEPIPAHISSAEGEAPWELVIQDKGVKYVDPEDAEPPEVKPCILVIHASAGSGHRTAAIAIEQELIRLRDSDEKLVFHGHEVPKDVDIELLDVFEWGRKPINGDHVISHFNGSMRPFYDFSWRYFFTGRLLWGGGTCYSRVYFPALTGYIKEKRPLAVVCTHITAANVAVGARMLSRQNFPVICVPTDYETEGQWPHREADLFCVATESMAETLRPRRIPEKNIQITGIPARDDFRRTYDREAVRAKLGLPQDKKIVLVLAGAHLAQPYVHLRTTLDKALPFFGRVEDRMQIVFLSGNDADYATHLRTSISELGLKCATVLDYVEEMAALMTASDLMICKPGGLTVTECLCARIPMMLVGRAYGQEKINMNMLTSMGAAIHVTTSRELVDVLIRLSEHPEVLDAMLVNGSLLRRPDAAEEIARATYELAYRPPEELQHRISHFVNLYWGLKPAHVR